MSKLIRKVKETRWVEKTGAEVNYMGGISYKINPLDTLKMVTASSIFAEPQYYRDGDGNYLLDENGEKQMIAIGAYWDGDHYRELYACSDKQVQSVLDVLTNTACMMDANDAIYDIVSEQARAFYAGQKSAEEVARLIQSKANIYVNEQR
jgi:hypothetical protein